MAPNKYKLTYFNLRGRAEVIRLLFRLAGQPFDDVRVTAQDWPQLKPNTPFGTLPVLEIEGGEKIGQSIAIARYLARQFGYAGKSPVEEALVDAYVDQISDAVQWFSQVFHEKHEDLKTALRKSALERLVTSMQPIEQRLQNHEYLVGTEITLADLRLVTASDFLKSTKVIEEEVFDAFPCVNAHTQRINNLPMITDWVRDRPQTKY